MTSADYLMNMLGGFREQGGTVIMTTHDVAQGLRCTDRVVVIDQGQVVLDRSISQIDQTQFVKNYLRYAKEST